MKAIAQGPTSVLRFPLPSFHHLIVEPLEEEYKGILHIPETAKDKPTEGRIIEVGPGRRSPEGVTVPIAFKKGQRIIFNRYSGTEIKYNEKLYLIIPEDEVKAYFP